MSRSGGGSRCGGGGHAGSAVHPLLACSPGARGLDGQARRCDNVLHGGSSRAEVHEAPDARCTALALSGL